ncbi:hypothetical protein ABZO31_01475 [Streptomyces sp. HUAS MG47]|uniref:hypothetical protein n=1 Tax=Streptomyces solicamelliae TaxID=3231716 RepID=UPI0038781A14
MNSACRVLDAPNLGSGSPRSTTRVPTQGTGDRSGRPQEHRPAAGADRGRPGRADQGEREHTAAHGGGAAARCARPQPPVSPVD